MPFKIGDICKYTGPGQWGGTSKPSICVIASLESDDGAHKIYRLLPTELAEDFGTRDAAFMTLATPEEIALVNNWETVWTDPETSLELKNDYQWIWDNGMPQSVTWQDYTNTQLGGMLERLGKEYVDK